ncbi:MAG: phospholipase D family protein [Candidatus Omnitrophota bacterium]
MKKFFVTLFLTTLILSCYGCSPQRPPLSVDAGNINVFFSPQDGCAKEVIYRIDQAQHSIYIVMYFFTSRDIAQALVRARQRGLEVRVCLHAPEKSSEYDKYSKDGYLKNSGISVALIKGKGIMHNKFCIIDETIVLTGSYNWTKRAEYENDENMVVIRSKDVARLYKEEFDRIYNGKKPSSFSYKDERGIDKIPFVALDAPVGTPSKSAGYYVGNKKSMKLHSSRCEETVRISPANKKEFKDKREALQKGYAPCKLCNP